jgi:hypothetical protein
MPQNATTIRTTRRSATATFSFTCFIGRKFPFVGIKRQLTQYVHIARSHLYYHTLGGAEQKKAESYQGKEVKGHK